MADITTIVSRTEALKTLAVALAISGVDETLGGRAPCTLFAPTNQAFLEAGVADALALAGDADELACVLLSHVVPGRRLTRDLVGNDRVQSLGEAVLELSSDEDGELCVEDACVVNGDIMADDGVIHIVDALVAPYPTESAPAGDVLEPPLGRLGDRASARPFFDSEDEYEDDEDWELTAF